MPRRPTNWAVDCLVVPCSYSSHRLPYPVRIFEIGASAG